MPLEVSFGLGSPSRDSKVLNGRQTKTLPEEARIQGSLEGFVAAALAVTVPPLFYITAYRHSVTQSEHLWSLMLLLSAPLVLLALLEVVAACFSRPFCHDRIDELCSSSVHALTPQQCNRSFRTLFYHDHPCHASLFGRNVQA